EQPARPEVAGHWRARVAQGRPLCRALCRADFRLQHESVRRRWGRGHGDDRPWRASARPAEYVSVLRNHAAGERLQTWRGSDEFRRRTPFGRPPVPGELLEWRRDDARADRPRRRQQRLLVYRLQHLTEVFLM